MSETPTPYRVGNVYYMIFRVGYFILRPEKTFYNGKSLSLGKVVPFPGRKTTTDDQTR